jgi:flagellum-specific peptidoglycan hydrolase FlgJ
MSLLDLVQNNTPALGLIGLSIMNAGQINPTQLMAALSAAQQNVAPQSDNYNPMPRLPDQQAQSTNQGIVPFKITGDTQNTLNTLKTQAAQAYPDNPNLQQVAITQALLESGLLSHPSQLAMNSNNLFGIKGQGTAGSVNMPTQEYSSGQMQNVNSNFAQNKTIADSFMQHRNLLNKPRYAPVLASQTPSDAFNALQRAGYATDPNYANKLNNIYTNYVAPLYY